MCPFRGTAGRERISSKLHHNHSLGHPPDILAFTRSRGDTLARMHICEICRQPVRPASDPGIVYAVELARTHAIGPTTEHEEGRGVFFHDSCFPTGSMRYQQKRMPDAIDDDE